MKRDWNSEMDTELDQLRARLIEGQRLSGQGSYQRRLPNKSALTLLIQARKGLRNYAESHPSDVEGWKLLSQAEECLLDYPNAESHLQKAIVLSGQKEKRDLKRLALLREYKTKWEEICLKPEQLAALGVHLKTQLALLPCEHTLAMTIDWLRESAVEEILKILNGFRRRGGYCDCEVLANVVQ